MAIEKQTPKFPKVDLVRPAKSVTFGLAKTGALKLLAGKALLGVNFGLGGSLTDEVELQSYLGTPVYDSFIFGYLNDKGRNNYIDEFGNTVSFEPMRLIEVLVSVQSTKNIVSTSVPGRNGDVHQYMSKGDYVITLNGRISGMYNTLKDEFQLTTNIREFQRTLGSLIKICEIGYSMPVASRHLQRFGINNVIITNYTMPQLEGVRNYQTFTINMISDNPDNLIFTEEEIEDNDLLSNIFNNAEPMD